MARYRGTVQGQRGVASRLGSANSGLRVTANGWNVGANVYIDPCEGCGEDIVDVVRTFGSNTGGRPRDTVARFHADGKGCAMFPDSAGFQG